MWWALNTKDRIKPEIVSNLWFNKVFENTLREYRFAKIWLSAKNVYSLKKIYTSMHQSEKSISDEYQTEFPMICALPASHYNRRQNLWNNVKKSSKVGQAKFLRNFWPLVPIFYLRKDGWVLGSASYHFCDIPNVSYFPKS